MIIAIDGPIATGKSTLAKTLAKQIGYIYFDTGAMYRCLTYGLLKSKVNIDDKLALNNYLSTFNFDYKILKGDRFYYVEGEDVTLKIRGHEVTSQVSKVSALPEVRQKLVQIQQRLAEGVNAVFEGRDMGTVVFPKAEIKIFLTGDPLVRAKRRLEELKVKLPEEAKNTTLDELLKEINDRDLYDSTRDISPLKQAPDALVIDTSTLSVDDIILKILEYKDTMKTKSKNPLE